MATMTLGMSNLPLPRNDDPFRMEYMPIGGGRRMADGSLRVQVVAGKWRIQPAWEGLTSTERNTLWAAFGGYCATSGVLTLPDGRSATVVTALGSWQESQWWRGSPGEEEAFYDVTFVMEEV